MLITSKQFTFAQPSECKDQLMCAVWFHSLRPCCRICLVGTELHFRVPALISV